MSGVDARSANLTIAKLLRAGLIRKAPGRKRDRLYLAADVMDAIEAPLGSSRRSYSLTARVNGARLRHCGNRDLPFARNEEVWSI